MSAKAPLFDRSIFTGLAFVATMPFLCGAQAETAGNLQQAASDRQPALSFDSSWALTLDNDFLVPGPHDQDYTYGINLAYTGHRAERHLTWLHAIHEKLDSRPYIEPTIASAEAYRGAEYGLLGFTPEDGSIAEPNPQDRPYASLIYVASSFESYYPSRGESWRSTLTLGVLGLDLVGDIQRAVHEVLGQQKPQGWSNQISAGGEPTVRLSISRQKLLYNEGTGLEVKTTLLGSAGFITEASSSLSLRAGRIRSPWISFNPELASYGEHSNPADSTDTSEHYFWAGAAVKMRVYNAFLQGQFRESEVSYDYDELNHVILEAWMGYRFSLASGYSFGYFLRGHTSEIRSGNANRSVVWGGIIISKAVG